MSASVMATLGASNFTSTIDVVTVMGGLVINEVDYDQIGTDADEFVEIYNGTGAPVNLTGYSLAFVNGATSTTYLVVDLGPAGTLPALGYLVVGSTTVTVPASAMKLNFVAATNNIQNGAPDGVALVNTTTGTLVDALSYEGALTATTVTGIVGMVNLVEGTVLPSAIADSNLAPASVCRLPSGNDTNNAATDWALSNTPTPGVANVP